LENNNIDNNFFIKLEKAWVYNNEGETYLNKYGSIALMAYSIMLRNMTTRNTFNFSINDLCNTLLINKRNDNAAVIKVKQAIIELSKELYTICTDSNCNIKVEDLSTLDNGTTYYCISKHEVLKDKFIIVKDNEIDKLITYSKGKKNTLSDVIAHFIFVVNGFKGVSQKDLNEGINCEGHLCFFGSLDYISKNINMNEGNLLSNNEAFRELNLLLIESPGGKMKDGTYKSDSNIYARKENQTEFEKFMIIKKFALGKSNTNSIPLQNEQRRLKQLMNVYKKSITKDVEITKDNISSKEFKELNKLEMDWYNCVIARKSSLGKPGLITMKLDGTMLEQFKGKVNKIKTIKEEMAFEPQIEAEVRKVNVNEEEIEECFSQENKTTVVINKKKGIDTTNKFILILEKNTDGTEMTSEEIEEKFEGLMGKRSILNDAQQVKFDTRFEDIIGHNLNVIVMSDYIRILEKFFTKMSA